MPLRPLFVLLSLSLVAAACGGADTTDGALDAGEVPAVDLVADGALPVDGSDDNDPDAPDSRAAASSSEELSTEKSAGSETMAGDPPPALASGSAATFQSAVGSVAAYETGRFEGRFELTGGTTNPTTESVAMTVTGSYDNPSQAVELAIDLGAFMGASLAGDGAVPPGLETFFDEPLSIIAIGDESWIQWSLLTFLTGQEDAWLATSPNDLDLASNEFAFAAGASDPTELLNSLVGADTDIEEQGTETIRGVETTHWVASVDIEALATDLDPDERAELEAQLGSLDAETLPVELWVGIDDGLLYRYRLTMASVPGEGEDAEAVITFELFDHGQPVGIEPPPADKIIDGEGLIFG